jgi:hypothetical protein
MEENKNTSLVYLPSLCNYSYVPKASRIVFGDVMVARALLLGVRRNAWVCSPRYKYRRVRENAQADLWFSMQLLVSRRGEDRWGISSQNQEEDI